jgi:hypothetical protein
MKKTLLLILFLSIGFQVFADCGHMKAASDCKDMEGCKEMMANREAMMADMKAMDAKLDELVAAMNTASGEKKVDAMSALLSEMVSQRRKMQSMMMGMHHPMPACAEHAGMKAGMSHCAGGNQ